MERRLAFTQLSHQYTAGKRRAPTDAGHSERDPQLEALQVQTMTEVLSEVGGCTHMPAFVAGLKPQLLSRHPTLLLTLANAATRGVGENADLLEDIARKCLQATQLMPEPSGADAVAVWQSLIAQLRGLPDRLAQALLQVLQVLQAVPMPEALRPDLASVLPPAGLAHAQPAPIGPQGVVWPLDILTLVAQPRVTAAELNSLAGFYRAACQCLTWLLVNKQLQKVQQPRLEALLQDWKRQWQVVTRAFALPAPQSLSVEMLHIFNASCFMSKHPSGQDPLLRTLNEATQSDAPSPLRTLLPYLWTQACLKWIHPNTQAQLVYMGQRLLAQLERCSLAVQRRLLLGMVCGGNRQLRLEALRRLRQIERHPSDPQRLQAEHIERCLGPGRLSTEDIDAVLRELEQTPPNQMTELPYLRLLAKISDQALTQHQHQRALNCALALLRFEAHCDRLGMPQTAHRTLYLEINNGLRTLATQTHTEQERQQLASQPF